MSNSLLENRERFVRVSDRDWLGVEIRYFDVFRKWTDARCTVEFAIRLLEGLTRKPSMLGRPVFTGSEVNPSLGAMRRDLPYCSRRLNHAPGLVPGAPYRARLP